MVNSYKPPELRGEINRMLNAMGIVGDLQERWWRGNNLGFNNKSPESVYAEDQMKVYLYVFNYLQR